MNVMRNRFIIFAVIALICSCNEYTLFTGKFVAFDLASSDVTTINEAGDFTATYYVHYSGETPKERFSVEYEVIPGDGLEEGRDYEVETSGRKLNFLPGVFTLPIRIHWMPNDIDPSKDNSVIIRLVSGPEDIILGMPGPDMVNKEIKLIKYKN